ncbi:CxxC motif-containing protein (DUF1111 family) [Litorivivens lipolytica]|uniref:CxxC motif-containing protein (DUF1111 family) n=1 Tax=Litorivivens lipolytica TaxID=1524264 RepID=A0A7W4Z6I6_9GAMM|nr:di-heme oxidoredictase family protein [Litorivivens lipolytica]MBB3048257.1 CxxC motif-containing protein (DUF1111 family) [Litorivivens lipolytica]
MPRTKPLFVTLHLFALTALLLQGACQSVEQHLPANTLGGALTSSAPPHQVSSTFTPEERLQYSLGASFFNKPWVTAPSTTHDRDGLGPLFNAHSCSSCHPRAGRGLLPGASTAERGGLLFRFANTGGPFGAQLQTRALPGFIAEGQVGLSYKEQTLRLADGETIALRKPNYLSEHPGLSPRLAPRLIGMGLIDAIPQKALAANADPDDRNRDGISGRYAGRFGWKGEQPTLRDQVAKAFAEDLGITNTLFSHTAGCEQNPARCEAISGGDPELSDEGLEQVVGYLARLNVPPARLSDEHREGWTLFQIAGCGSCHTPSWQTGQHAEPQLNEQTIYPFSDFLLHDMGEALSDPASADAREWRTASLWALGDGPYLHDGRARTVLEAIFWHGGEAQQSVDAVRQFTGTQRAALIEFLRAL